MNSRISQQNTHLPLALEQNAGRLLFSRPKPASSVHTRTEFSNSPVRNLIV
jgi:hypothetical protein